MVNYSRILLSIALLAALQVRADVLVVVNRDNPVQSMSINDVAALYLGRARSFPSGELALVFDLRRNDPLREQFFRRVAGMTMSQVNTYWSRLMFSGQEMPPQALPDEKTVLAIVRRNPGAIGYVSTLPESSGVRVVLRLDD